MIYIGLEYGPNPPADWPFLVKDIPEDSEGFFFLVSDPTKWVWDHDNIVWLVIYKLDSEQYCNSNGELYLKPFKRIALPEDFCNPITLYHLAYYYASKESPEWRSKNDVNSFTIHKTMYNDGYTVKRFVKYGLV